MVWSLYNVVLSWCVVVLVVVVVVLVVVLVVAEGFVCEVLAQQRK